MKKARWGLLAFLMLTLVSCYPSYDRETEDYDVAVTVKHGDNFNNDEGQKHYKSFFLADTVMHLADSLKDKYDPEFPTEYDSHILSEVKNHFITLGYTEITDTLGPDPDVLISISTLATKNTVVYSYYPGYWWGGGYWGGYWGGYPGWGGGYWPTYPSYSVYTYNKGSVFIDMVSYDETQPLEDEIEFEWTGIVNGLLYEGNNPTEERLSTSLDLLFEKAPYLQVIN